MNKAKHFFLHLYVLFIHFQAFTMLQRKLEHRLYHIRLHLLQLQCHSCVHLGNSCALFFSLFLLLFFALLKIVALQCSRCVFIVLLNTFEFFIYLPPVFCIWVLIQLQT